MSLVKKCITTRFKYGTLLEVDYKQLEVFALAFLSDDKQLKEDLIHGVDIHAINAAALAGVPLHMFLARLASGDPLAIKQRKLAKTLSFQLQYGAGPSTLAEKNGITLTAAKRFISNYYYRYPRIKEWHIELLQEVKRKRVPSPKHSATGVPIGMSTITSITGRRYTFFEEDSFNSVSFSPTAIKNFPVQGFATGDIVPLVLGKLHQMIYDKEWQDSVLLVNTIHDSVLFDIRDFVDLRIIAGRIKEVMENAPLYLKQQFGIDFDLPLKVDMKIGENWQEMLPYEY